MNAHFLTSSEKNKLLAELEHQFGITSLPPVLLETGKEKVRAFSGSLSAEELLSLSRSVNIEIIGLYVARKEHDVKNLDFPVLEHDRESRPQDSRRLRLSFDATQVFSSQLSKNIVDITEEQRVQWIRGQDLEIKAQKGTLVIRCDQDFLGCGKSTGDKIINHVPKERRLKK